MSIEFPDLPYAADALEPHISARTFEFHHGKHHKAYVDKLNAAITGTDYENQSLEEIIAAAHQASDNGIFNNAAQAWNHTFLWHSMAPNGMCLSIPTSTSGSKALRSLSSLRRRSSPRSR